MSTLYGMQLGWRAKHVHVESGGSEVKGDLCACGGSSTGKMVVEKVDSSFAHRWTWGKVLNNQNR